MNTELSGFDAIVAGAGVWGCTLARRLAEAGRRVLVLEKRSAVGGNVRCETDPETGIEIHTYGSHIFHTHLPEVWAFVNRFVSFNGYQHKVLANYRGRVYQLPLGLNLINKFFGVELQPGEVAAFMADEARSAAIFDAFFRGYTSKQWGRPPEAIDPSIIRRVPVRSNYDTNYFNDYWQGIPAEGYNALFERLLDHPAITVRCNTPFSLSTSPASSPTIELSNLRTFEPSNLQTSQTPVYYSGPIDALFDYRFGALPWRSLRFERETLAVRDWQGTSVVNYTEAEVPYTRIHEFKHYHPEGQLVAAGKVATGSDWGWKSDKTVVMREYPADWRPGDEPYYPIANPESAALLAKYQAEAAKIPNLVIGGRLGGYRYYDMDQAVDAALKVEI